MRKIFYVIGDLQLYEFCGCPDCKGGHKDCVKRVFEEIVADDAEEAQQKLLERYWGSEGETPVWLNVQVGEGSLPEDQVMRRLGAPELFKETR